MRLILCVVSIVLSFHSITAFSQDIEGPGMKDSLVSKIKEFKNETKLKSVIAGLWKGEDEIFTIALGESMTNVPAEKDMHFRIGGVSETFLGTLLMILVDKGKISLDDKISKWLPTLLASDSVTVGMLMKNTAGYKDYVLNDDFIDMVINQPFRQITTEEIISYSVSDGQLNFRPGTDSRYSHTEFTILEEVLKKATGKTMPDLYEEYLFNPLHLQNTGYMVTPELPFPVLHAFSKDREVYEESTYWNPSWTGGSGPLYSNLYDLGKWGYIFGTGKLLTEQSFNILIDRYNGIGKPEFYFASGFGVSNGWLFQNPSFNGFNGAFGYQVDSEYTLVVYSTIGEDTKTDTKAIDIFKELVKIITPDKPLNF